MMKKLTYQDVLETVRVYDSETCSRNITGFLKYAKERANMERNFPAGSIRVFQEENNLEIDRFIEAFDLFKADANFECNNIQTVEKIASGVILNALITVKIRPFTTKHQNRLLKNFKHELDKSLTPESIRALTPGMLKDLWDLFLEFKNVEDPDDPEILTEAYQ